LRKYRLTGTQSRRKRKVCQCYQGAPPCTYW